MSTPPASSPPRFRIGTSGYNYAEWKGTFYPEKLPARKMLPFYAQQLETVEINYTFYRLPTERLLAGWSEVTPPGFAFTLKAPRRITHEARLRRCEEVTERFCEFRHPSWHDEAVFERLSAAGQTLCVADSERMSTPVTITAPYAYFRLRDEGYTDADVVRWAETISKATANCGDVFVYFKHEESGKGPALAKRLTEALGLSPQT